MRRDQPEGPIWKKGKGRLLKTELRRGVVSRFVDTGRAGEKSDPSATELRAACRDLLEELRNT